MGIFYKPKTKTHPFSYLFFAWGSSTLIIFHLISCPLILEPCLLFVYRPLTDSCFLITFLFRTGPDVSFWVFFYAKNKKQNTNSCSYLFFAWGSSNLIIFHLVHNPIFLQRKSDFTRVFDTPIQRKPTASERQNSTEIVRKRFGSRKHTFPYPAANRLIIVNDKRRFNGNEPFEVKSVQTVQVVSLVVSFGRTAGGERGKSGPAKEEGPILRGSGGFSIWDFFFKLVFFFFFKK